MLLQCNALTHRCPGKAPAGEPARAAPPAQGGQLQLPVSSAAGTSPVGALSAPPSPQPMMDAAGDARAATPPLQATDGATDGGTPAELATPPVPRARRHAKVPAAAQFSPVVLRNPEEAAAVANLVPPTPVGAVLFAQIHLFCITPEQHSSVLLCCAGFGFQDADESSEEDDERPVPRAGPPRTVVDAWNVPALSPRQSFTVTDSNSMEDLQAWVHCPKRRPGEEARCIIHRSEKRWVLVFDATCTIWLHVQRCRCKTHNDTQFGLTHPAVFQQLCAKGLRMSHDLVVLSKKMVITKAAYECAPAGFVRETCHGHESIACACPSEPRVACISRFAAFMLLPTVAAMPSPCSRAPSTSRRRLKCGSPIC